MPVAVVFLLLFLVVVVYEKSRKGGDGSPAPATAPSPSPSPSPEPTPRPCGQTSHACCPDTGYMKGVFCDCPPSLSHLPVDDCSASDACTRFDTSGVQSFFKEAGLQSVSDLCSKFHVRVTASWSWCSCPQVLSGGKPHPAAQLDQYWVALNALTAAGALTTQFGDTLLKQLVFAAAHLTVIGQETYAFKLCHESAGNNGCNWKNKWGPAYQFPALGTDCDQKRRDCGRGQNGRDYNYIPDGMNCCKTKVRCQAEDDSGNYMDEGCPYGKMECNTTDDNKGACWWGRGAGQLTGPCNYQQLASFLAEHKVLGVPDVCSTPDELCSTQGSMYWMSSLVYFLIWLKTHPKETTNFGESLDAAAEAVRSGRIFDLRGSYWGCDDPSPLNGAAIPFLWGLYGANAAGQWMTYGDALHPNRGGYGCSSGWFVGLLHALLAAHSP